MSNSNISDQGIELAKELEAILSGYHIKSDEYNVVAWEIDVLKAKARYLLEGGQIIPSLKYSVLVGDSSARVAGKYPELVKKVSEFHYNFKQVVG